MSPDSAELRRLKGDLRSEDAAARAGAVDRAAEVIDGTIMSVLSEALLSENAEVRGRALTLLDHLTPNAAADTTE